MIKRTTIAALSVSAAALVGLALNEGYTDKPVIPVQGDVPTIGFGSTVREDGSSVTMNDTITPPKALARTLTHIQKDESGIRSCVTAELYQAEYDTMVDFAYQYGVNALCKSSIVREANAGNYVASCEAYLKYKYVAGFDCSTPDNRRCPGVWKRSKERYLHCMKAQNG